MHIDALFAAHADPSEGAEEIEAELGKLVHRDRDEFDDEFVAETLRWRTPQPFSTRDNPFLDHRRFCLLVSAIFRFHPGPNRVLARAFGDLRGPLANYLRMMYQDAEMSDSRFSGGREDILGKFRRGLVHGGAPSSDTQAFLTRLEGRDPAGSEAHDGNPPPLRHWHLLR